MDKETSDKAWNLTKMAQEFFVYTNLGIVPKRMYCNDSYKKYFNEEYGYNDDNFTYETYCTYMCAIRAYRDFSRTIHYNKSKDIKKNKEDFKKAVYKYLTRNIKQKNCKGLIETIYDIANKYDIFEKEYPFSYGQAQKWVNMTLKYLWLLGMDNNKYTNIPIDSFILYALDDLEYDLPKEKDGRKKPWSKWSDKDYETIEKYSRIKDKLWEHEAWIKISEKRKGIKKEQNI